MYAGQKLFEYRLVPTQDLVDSGLTFPQNIDTVCGETFRTDAVGHRIVESSIYPHLVIASNGLLFNEERIRPVDVRLPGLLNMRSLIDQWLVLAYLDAREERALLAGGRSRKHLRSASASDPDPARPPKRRAAASTVSSEFWYEDPDYSDELSSDGSLEDEFLSRPVDSPVRDSIDRWILQEPSSLSTPPLTPILKGYQDELSFSPPDDKWTAWPQTWRDVVIQPV